MDRRDLRRVRQRRERLRRRLALTLVAAAGIAVLLGFAAFRSAPRPAAPRPVATPVPRFHRDPEPPPAPVRPPQFLVVSFDGSGGVRLWPYWRSIAPPARAPLPLFVGG